MEKLGCIIDSDENYAVRICSCFNACRSFNFNFRAFTSVESYMGCAIQNEVELLILSADIYNLPDMADKFKSSAAKIICLDEGSHGPKDEAGVYIIGKYQASDSIVRDAGAIYGTVSGNSQSKDEVQKIIGVYSPNGACYKTSLSLALAFLYGKNNKVLYFNMSEFSGEGEKLPARNGNLSDAMFYYETSGRMALGKVAGLINTGNGFDYMAPAVCAGDIANVDAGFMSDMIAATGQSQGYDIVILDIGNFVRAPWQLVSDCDICYMPEARNSHEEKRINEFESFLLGSGMEKTMDKIKKIRLPYEEMLAREAAFDYQRLCMGNFGKLVSSLVT